jgi:putative aldouronate transport system substrate-binding protein
MALLLLALSLVAAGCGSDDDDPSGDNGDSAVSDLEVNEQFYADEPLTIPILFSDHPNYPYQEDWMFWEELAERTNVTLEVTPSPSSDYDQKRSLALSDPNPPYIIPKTYPDQETPFVASGSILRVSDYFDLMPNFQDKVEKWGLEADVESLAQTEGGVYLLPGLHENLWPDYSLTIRKDVWDDLGLDIPETWDDLRDDLRAVKDEYPDHYPLSDRFEGLALLNVAAAGFGTQAGWGLGDMLMYNADNNEFEFTGSLEGHRELIEYFHSLVDEGLMDPESFTQEDDLAVQKFVIGESKAISSNSQMTSVYQTSLDSNLGEGEYEIVRLRIPAGPAGDRLVGSRLENGIMITTAAKEDPRFEEIMGFVDWLWYSDDGQEFAKWGVEGTTFERDDDGKRTFLPDITHLEFNPDGTTELQADLGFGGGNFAYGGTTELLYSFFTEEEIALQEQMLTKEAVPVDPPIPFDELDQEEIALLQTPLSDFVAAQTLGFILGDRPLSEWDDYVAELQDKQVDRYVEFANNAYHAYEEAVQEE